MARGIGSGRRGFMSVFTYSQRVNATLKEAGVDPNAPGLFNTITRAYSEWKKGDKSKAPAKLAKAIIAGKDQPCRHD